MAVGADGRLVDPYGGARDIGLRLIRATSWHFCEDPVRALRAARQAAEIEAAKKIAALESRLNESQAREQAARSALMDAQMVKPDTALAAENARLQSELLKAHDALNRAGARQPEPERKPERPILLIERNRDMIWTIRVNGRAELNELSAALETVTKIIFDFARGAVR